MGRALRAMRTQGLSPAAATLSGLLGYLTLVACGVLAVYPDDIMAAHTLLLEPWMNLLVLAGARLAFRDGRLAATRRLGWAGAAFGLAGTVKYWAALPALALLVTCLLSGPADGPGGRRGERAARRRDAGAGAVRFSLGLLAGFAVPVLPFAAEISRCCSTIESARARTSASGSCAAFSSASRAPAAAGYP